MTSTNHQTDSPPSEGVAGTAREEAGQLKQTSTDAASQVAGTVKDAASEVTADAREQTRRLVGQTRDELITQAAQQKERATTSLRSVGDELRGMAEHGQAGLGSQLARHGADFTDQAADFLQKHEPGDLLNEVRRYAKRNPGTFLLAAAAAGVVAGRLTRALAAGGTGVPVSSGKSHDVGASIGTVDEDYLVPPPAAPVSAPPVGQTTPPPPVPTPSAPDLDPGAPVTPRFGPGSAQ
jgi:hypothetical protein